jgi:hypothetical protein
MTTGEYIDTLLCEIDSLRRERDLYESEGATLLKVVFDAIETPSYVNPWGIFNYLKAVYPNRYKRKMDSYEDPFES